MLRHSPSFSQGVLHDARQTLYIPTGPDAPVVDGALLDAELAESGLALAPGWEDEFNIVRLNDRLFTEVTVSRKESEDGWQAA